MTLNYGNYGIVLIRGNAGFASSTVRCKQGPGRAGRSQKLAGSLGRKVPACAGPRGFPRGLKVSGLGSRV